MRNVIFIEGVSGVGKTTAVHSLGEELARHGYSVKCHYEGDPDGPLDLCWTAYLELWEYEKLLGLYPAFADEFEKNIIDKGDYILLRYQIRETPLYTKEIHEHLHQHEFCYNPTHSIVPLSKFTEVFASLWRQFAKSGETACDYAIFDASLVSHMTNDLLRNYQASVNDLAKHLEILIETINPLNPIVFYLSSANVCERLTKARHSRGQTPVTDQKIKFWEKRKQMDLAILPRLSVKSHTYEIVNDQWDPVIHGMLSQLTHYNGNLSTAITKQNLNQSQFKEE